MKIDKARGLADLVRLLYRLKIVDIEYADAYIDYLTVLVLTADMNKTK